MHTVQTQNTNLGVRAGAEQLLTAVRQLSPFLSVRCRRWGSPGGEAQL